MYSRECDSLPKVCAHHQALLDEEGRSFTSIRNDRRITHPVSSSSEGEVAIVAALDRRPDRPIR